VVVFLGAVIPMLISTYSGVKTNEARFLTVARSFGASEFRIFSTIVLPGTVPFIFTGLKYGAGRALPSSVPFLLTGLRLGVGRAMIGIVVGELYAATAGSAS
jgi:NitT/TauT family transport system permease protein